MLVPLLRTYDLVARLVAKDERKEADRRAKEIAEDPGNVSGAVRLALSSTQVAVYVAVFSAVVISASSDGGGGDGGGG